MENIVSKSVVQLKLNRQVLMLQRCQMSKVAKRAKYFPAITTPMLPKGCFDGKVAFVTGGGTGLGKGMAKMLSELGAKVMIASRNIEVLQKTADEISELTNNQVLAQSCDVRDPHSVKTAVSECVHHFGLPNVIVNNAAGNFACPSERLSNNAWKAVIDIVLNGTANVTLDIGKRLINARQGASFLSISTIYAISGSGYVLPSCAAKSGVEGLTKSLASEWAKYGMRFNCIQPGVIETKGAMSRLDPTGHWREQAVQKKIAAGRYGEIEEHANLACYLLSDYANWITGSIIRLDGGEFNYTAGQFNELDSVSSEEWDMLESTIRKGGRSSD